MDALWRPRLLGGSASQPAVEGLNDIELLLHGGAGSGLPRHRHLVRCLEMIERPRRRADDSQPAIHGDCPRARKGSSGGCVVTPRSAFRNAGEARSSARCFRRTQSSNLDLLRRPWW